MLEGGFILLHRSILRWEWYGDLNTARLFIHLLLTVNYEPQRWQGIAVERGQRVASLAKLADETGLTVKQVRTALEHLKRTGEVTHTATSKYGLFTVNHYDRYQPRGEPEGTPQGMENGIQGAGGGQAKGSNGRKNKKAENDVLGGLQRGCLYIIAARPGDGKTDFALHLAVQLAKRCRVDYRSLEMTKEQLVHRVLSRVCMINSTRFRDHDLDENAQKRIGIAAARMGDLHLVMDDTPGVSAGDVEAKLASGKPDVMFIDYLGLMRGDAAGNKPLWQITGEITHALKESARRHGAAVVALVQLARAADRQKEPALSDLKGGSDIEADADGVIFMRPQKTGEFLSGDDAWPVEAVIAKNRHGGVGRLRFNWQPQYHNYVPTDNTRR